MGKKVKVEYRLVYQRAKTRGYVMLERYAEVMKPEELVPMMTDPGLYLMQEIVDGKIARYVWDKPYVVEEVVAEPVEEERMPRATDSDRIAQAIENDMLRAVRWFTLPEMIQKAMIKVVGGEEKVKGMFGGGPAVDLKEGETMDGWIDRKMTERDERIKSWAESHGYTKGTATTTAPNIPISGSIPAALAYAPTIADQIGEQIERRLERWGVISTGGVSPSGEKLIDMPKKPGGEKGV